jgi:flavin-dependent dehydrogenase
MIQNSIVIVGGLAGLTAIHLKNNNYNVLVIEKNEFPKHKVCGEYIPTKFYLLKILGLDINSLHPKHIDKLSFSVSGKSINTVCLWADLE